MDGEDEAPVRPTGERKDLNSIRQITAVEGGDVTLVGTSHISRTSARLVARTITATEPDIVAVEICPERFEAYSSEAFDRKGGCAPRPKVDANAKTQRIISRGWPSSTSFPAETEKGHFGTDFLTAIRTAGKRGVPIATIDRPIGETVRRLNTEVDDAEYAAYRFFSRLSRVVPPLRQRVVVARDGDIDVSHPLPCRLVKPVAYGTAEQVLTDDRNEFMSARLKALANSGCDVVSVTGFAHLDGLEQLLRDSDVEPEEPVVFRCRE